MSSRKSLEWSHSDKSMVMGAALKELQLCFDPSSGSQDAGFHCDYKMLVFKVTVELRKEQ